MRSFQNGPRDSGQWFRMGIVSATVVTPLVSRWRSLRAAERARVLWDASRANTQWPWAQSGATMGGAAPAAVAVTDPMLAPPRPSVRPGLWLAGVGVGLAVAGAAAFVIARRRMQSNEAPVEVPWPAGANGNGTLMQTLAHAGPPHAASAPTDASLDSAADFEPAPLSDAVESTSHPSASVIPLAFQSAALESDGTSVASPVQLDSENAPIIGNTRTLVYHLAGDPGLPAPEHRIFFVSAAQAEAHGYRPDPGNVGPGSRTDHGLD